MTATTTARKIGRFFFRSTLVTLLLVSFLRLAPADSQSHLFTRTLLPSKTVTLPKPASVLVERFQATSVIAAFAAQLGGDVSQADALNFTFANYESRNKCPEIKQAVNTNFAYHRSIDALTAAFAKYVDGLRAAGTPLQYQVENTYIQTTQLGLTAYDFKTNSFKLTDSLNSDFNVKCVPDTSYITDAPPGTLDTGWSIALIADNDQPTFWRLSPDAAEQIVKQAAHYTYSLRVVFYGTTITSNVKDPIYINFPYVLRIHVVEAAVARRSVDAPSAAEEIVYKIPLK